jgi:periplasmic protein CpxP/Spy
MKASSVVQATVLAVAALVAAGDATAQFGGIFGGMGRRGTQGGGNQGGGGDNSRNERSVPSRETGPGQQQVMLHELHTDLKLTQAQEPAWNAYVDKLNAIAADAARESVRAQSPAQINAMQQFDRVLDSARNRLTALEDVAAAAKTLYAGLSDEQKLVADSRLAKLLPGAGEGRQPGNVPDRQMGRRREAQ